MSNSLSFYYIIFGIVLLHVFLGFAWVIYKFMKPAARKDKTGDSKKPSEQ